MLDYSVIGQAGLFGGSEFYGMDMVMLVAVGGWAVWLSGRGTACYPF